MSCNTIVVNPGTYPETVDIERSLNDGSCLGSGWTVRRVEKETLVTEVASCKTEHLAKLPGTNDANAHSPV